MLFTQDESGNWGGAVVAGKLVSSLAAVFGTVASVQLAAAGGVEQGASRALLPGESVVAPPQG